MQSQSLRKQNNNTSNQVSHRRNQNFNRNIIDLFSDDFYDPFESDPFNFRISNRRSDQLSLFREFDSIFGNFWDLEHNIFSK
jgi:hypothetical protein